jgi:RhtB (resistance to homoserine/threonine) family protein
MGKDLWPGDDSSGDGGAGEEIREIIKDDFEMFDVTYWLMFFAAALAINISPGPDMIYVLSQTVSHGRKVGFCSSLGVCSGAVVHILMVAFGLSAVLTASAVAFIIIKTIGAGYLFYLGIRALFSKASGSMSQPQNETGLTPWAAYKQGILVDLLNPKAILFFVAFLPQFVRPGAGSFTLQIIGLGLMVLMMAIPIDGCFILAAGKAVGVLRNRPGVARWLDKAMGTVLVGLGVDLLLTARD